MSQGSSLSLWQLVVSDARRHGGLMASAANLGFHAALCYRFSHWFHVNGLDVLGKFVQWWGLLITGADISRKARIDHGLGIFHAQAILVGPGVVVGWECNLHQGCALTPDTWSAEKESAYPRLEERVYVGAGAKILGGVLVGHDARVAPNSVVLKDVPAGATALGVPARMIDPRFRHER